MSGSSVFSRERVDHLTQPMWFGSGVNIARYETQKYPEFNDFTDKQLGFFWRPDEVRLVQDRIDFERMAPHQRHIFVSNLEYQILMDSVQGRAPSRVLGPVTSLPEVENWIDTWNFSETIHSRSYTHMIREIMPNPSLTFDSILDKREILDRADQVSRYYDRLHELNVQREIGAVGYNEQEHRRALVLCLYSINVLEAIRFYGSFACTFLFAKNGMMEGSAKIMRFIARDEALHHSGTNTLIGILRDGHEGPEWAETVRDCEPEVVEIFSIAVQQELDWARYLFQHGSMLGMNAEILGQYVRYIANARMSSLGLPTLFEPIRHDPLPWMREYLVSENVQNTPQETENSQYLIGQIDQNLTLADLNSFDFE